MSGRTGRSSAGQKRSISVVFFGGRLRLEELRREDYRSSRQRGHLINRGSVAWRWKLRQRVSRPRFDLRLRISGDRLRRAPPPDDHALPKDVVLGILEAIAAQSFIAGREVAGRLREPRLRDDVDEQSAWGECAAHRREEVVLQPLAVLTLVVGRVEPEAGERLVAKPHREGAAGDEVIQDPPSLGGAVGLEFDPVGLAATDGVGKLPQCITRSAAGVQQPCDTAMRSVSGADERRHAFDDRRRSRVELRLRDAFKASHTGLRALSVKPSAVR